MSLKTKCLLITILFFSLFSAQPISDLSSLTPQEFVCQLLEFQNLNDCDELSLAAQYVLLRIANCRLAEDEKISSKEFSRLTNRQNRVFSYSRENFLRDCRFYHEISKFSPSERRKTLIRYLLIHILLTFLLRAIAKLANFPTLLEFTVKGPVISHAIQLFIHCYSPHDWSSFLLLAEISIFCAYSAARFSEAYQTGIHKEKTCKPKDSLSSKLFKTTAVDSNHLFHELQPEKENQKNGGNKKNVGSKSV